MDVKGKADIMFFNKLDAITAVKKFNGLTLDGRPMQVSIKDPATSKRNPDVATSKALLFGSSSRMRGGDTSGPSFSVTLGGANKQPKKQKTIVVKQAPKKKDKKPKAGKTTLEALKPKSADDLNMEMDSYFANRPSKAASA